VYGELASVQGIVDLSPEEALDSPEVFLERQGYVTAGRKGTTLTMKTRRYSRVRLGRQKGEGKVVPMWEHAEAAWRWIRG
jgi:hypothetical protein